MNSKDKIKLFFEGVEKASNTLDLELIDYSICRPVHFCRSKWNTSHRKTEVPPCAPETTGILQIDGTPIH